MFFKQFNLRLGSTKMTQFSCHTFKSKISTQNQVLIKYFFDLRSPRGSILFGISYQWNYSVLQNVDSLMWISEEDWPFQRPLIKNVYNYYLLLGRILGFEGVAHHFQTKSVIFVGPTLTFFVHNFECSSSCCLNFKFPVL